MKNLKPFRDKTPEVNFWVDLPQENLASNKLIKTGTGGIEFIGSLIRYTSVLLAIYLIFRLIGPEFGIGLVLFVGLTLFVGLYSQRKIRAEQKKIDQILGRAREITAAETIGSAIHVAGHPLLERDQPIVFALRRDELAIHAYHSQVPIDVIRISDIKVVSTVVYDNDRIPHMDVLDNTAQSLQMIIGIDGKEYKCLFRRFLRVRAIDWYHELQKAKFKA